MADFTRVNAVLARLLPALLQQKMEKERLNAYLQNNLREIAAGEAATKARQKGELLNSIMSEITGSAGEWSKGQPFSPFQLKETLGSLLSPELTGELPLNPEAPDMQGKIKGAMFALRNMLAAQGAGITPDTRDVGAVLEGFGEKQPSKIVSDIVQEQGATKGRALTEKGQALTKSGQGIRERELTLEEKKTEEAASPQNKKTAEVRTLLSSTQSQISTLQKSLELFGVPEADKPAVKAKVAELEQKVDTYRNYLEESILADPSLKDADYVPVIADLKAKGWNKAALMGNKELQNTLILNGYAITRILQLWK